MANNLTVKDSTGTTKTIHTIEDAGGVHFNQSIATDAAGNIAAVVSANQLSDPATMGALVVAIRDTVSIKGHVSVRGGFITTIGGVSLGSSSALIGKVSIQGISQVSVAGLVTVDAKSNTGAAVPAGAFYVGGVDGGGLLRGLLTDTGGRLVVNVSNQFTVSVADKVSIAGAVAQAGTWTVQPGNTQNTTPWLVSVADKVSIGGAVAQSGTWTVQPGNTANTTPWLVSVNGIPLVAQSGTWTVQPGNTANTTPWLVSVNSNIAVSVQNTVLVSLNGVLVAGDTTDAIAPSATANKVNTQARLLVLNQNSNTYDRVTGTSAGLNAFMRGTTGGTSPETQTIRVDTSGVQIATGQVFTNQYLFTRPADVTAYSGPGAAGAGLPNAGDLIANSTTQSAVVPLKFRVSRSPGVMAYVRRARLFKTSDTQNVANGTEFIRLHLFNTNSRVSAVNADNGFLLCQPVSDYVGYIGLSTPTSSTFLRTKGTGTSTVWLQGAPNGIGNSNELVFMLGATQVSIQGLLESRVAWTPASGERIVVQLDVFNA